MSNQVIRALNVIMALKPVDFCEQIVYEPCHLYKILRGFLWYDDVLNFQLTCLKGISQWRTKHIAMVAEAPKLLDLHSDFSRLKVRQRGIRSVETNGPILV